jgi:hypothetical protein
VAVGTFAEDVTFAGIDVSGKSYEQILVLLMEDGDVGMLPRFLLSDSLCLLLLLHLIVNLVAWFDIHSLCMTSF